MKYQVRIEAFNSDEPASELMNSYADAVKRLDEVRAEIAATWKTPIAHAYIFTNDRA